MISERQKEFARNFAGNTPGRYHILYLTIINIAGGDEMRKDIQARYGRENYSPNKMYPSREEVMMVIAAVERGVSAERIGRMIPQTYKRSNPEVMKALNRDNAIDIFVNAWDGENEYVQRTIAVIERGPNHALIAKKINPMPCDLFKGAILGLFEILNIPCTCEEIKCHWQNESEESCVYKVAWK
jgi:hypothetical protein